jgi:hypothetical protein
LEQNDLCDDTGSGPTDATGEQASLLSDRALVRQTCEEALRLGESEHQAWRAAVGAYLERHSGCDVGRAETMVTVLIRQD